MDRSYYLETDIRQIVILGGNYNVKKSNHCHQCDSAVSSGGTDGM